MFGMNLKVLEMQNPSLLLSQPSIEDPRNPAATTEPEDNSHRCTEIHLIVFQDFFPPVKWLVFPQVQ